MGNSSSNKSSFEQHNWRKIEQKANRTILYNDITLKSVQRHEAVLDCDQGQAISMCKWRASLPQDCCVVDLYEYGIKKTGMCNSQSDLYVITQRIHLLQEIGTISKPQAFLILRDIASGLRVLFRKFGYFNPKPNIIGINSQGKAKVWTNQNFAKLQPQKDTIPLQQSQLGLVNNLIRILQSKTYNDHSLPIDYPRNLDLSSVIGYINKVFTDLHGFEVDRVYVDRTQFNKKYNQLRQRNQKQQISRMIATQQQRKLQQIQILHQNLRIQQQELMKKQQELKLQALQQEQILRQQQLQRQYQYQQQLKQQEIQNILAVQQAQQVQLALQQTQAQQQPQQTMTIQQMPVQNIGSIQQQIFPSRMYVHPQNNINTNEVITDNSQGKILRGTASTNRSDLYGQSGQYVQGQGQGQQASYGNLLLVPQQAANSGNNTFRQSSVGKPNPYTQTSPQKPMMNVNTNNYDMQQGRNSLPAQISPQPQPQQPQPQNINMNPRPPLPPPPRQQPLQQQAPIYTPQYQQQQPQSRPSSGQRRQRNGQNQNIRKQIQMVDSMILMQEDQMSDQQNKRYVQSRILTYKI